MTLLVDRPSLFATAAAQNAVFTRAQALACGVSEDEARRNLRDNIWVAVRRGVYVEAGTWTSADEQRRNVLRLQAVALKTEPPCVGSHTTAAAVLGIELWDPSYDFVNVTRPSCSGRREAGVWHHEATLPAEEVVESSGLLVTSVLRSAYDVARSGIDHEHAVVAIDSALRLSGNTFEQRAAALAELLLMHLGRTDWHGSRIAGGAVAFADPRAGSPGESRTRVQLARLDMPAPLTQLFVHDELGRLVGIADFGMVQHKTLVEFDGREKYGLDGLTSEAVAERLWREKRREDELRRLGWEIVRLVWADLYRPERITRLLRDAFARAAAHPGPVRGSFSLVPH